MNTNHTPPSKTTVLAKPDRLLKTESPLIDGQRPPAITPEFRSGYGTRTATLPTASSRGVERPPMGAPRSARPQLNLIILGSSITSSVGNGHATTYRGLVRELTARGHHVLFLERDSETPAANRDLSHPPYGRTEFYTGMKDLKERFGGEIRDADFVIVGSHVQDGIAIGDWVTRSAHGATAFYDLDTPVTIANLIRRGVNYISPALIPRFQIYLSFSGGPILHYLEKHYRSPMARPLYCSADATVYFPETRELKWDLGYLGNYSEERQPALNRLFMESARRWSEGDFVVAGPEYPRTIQWPKNVKRIPHVPPAKRRAFYNSQRYTMNVTRSNMVAVGYSPSVRLFEAAACGTPIITDSWPGLETFFTPDEEILISHSSDETLIYLEEISELERRRLGYRARECVLAKHTSRHRAAELETYALQVLKVTAV